MKNKHLSFEERLVIEEGLNKGISVNAIAKKLDRPASSVSREIQRNRHISSNELKDYIPCAELAGGCERHNVCGDTECMKDCANCLNGCGRNCKGYRPQECKLLKKSPFVCNGCSKCENNGRIRCRKYRYSAKSAQLSYEMTLKQSRDGITLSPEEMEALDNLVSPLLLQGQSVSVIYNNHQEDMPCAISTLYDYIDKGYLTAKNVDLARKVRYKKRYSRGKKTKDFQKFVIGRTDRGTEFSNPYGIECDRNGEIKTKVFYCDPYCSWQKGRVEKNHEFIRMVLPKGKSFDEFTQTDIDLMMDHINSYPREQHNGKTPYEISELFLGNDFLQAMGCHLIPPDEVTLRPALLRRAR